ncbi:MAG TPA: hypothetical protein VFU44_03150 [Candidatus Limnocylindria bacterium]|jgi:hypothetical protein|nr:hypothetical protein [Candidatus Limnocylindria bacterium]
MAREVMVRTYSGNSQQDALVLYAQDAPARADDGWVPVSQTWANGEWPTQAYFAATLLILAAGIGVVLLIVMAMYKPKRVLVVTYAREERSPPSA